jgi:hypothetical protein
MLGSPSLALSSCGVWELKLLEKASSPTQRPFSIQYVSLLMTFSPKTFSADILEIAAAFQPREENLNEAVLPLSQLHSVKHSNFPIQEPYSPPGAFQSFQVSFCFSKHAGSRKE